MLFNMNDYIRVRLTDEGREQYRQSVEALRSLMPPTAAAAFPFKPRKEDANGWSEWQGWELMRTFGPWMTMAAPVPFEMTVDIPSLKQVDISSLKQGD